MSLEIQRKDCEQYALRNEIPIMGYFGGTYESAKTDAVYKSHMCLPNFKEPDNFPYLLKGPMKQKSN